MKSTLHFFSVLSTTSIKRLLLLFFTLFALSVPTWGANISSGAKIYLDISGHAKMQESVKVGKKLQVMAGHGTYSICYEMKQEGTCSNLYVVTMPKWDGCTQLAFITADAIWGGEGGDDKSPQKRSEWGLTSSGYTTSVSDMSSTAKHLYKTTATGSNTKGTLTRVSTSTYKVTLSSATNGSLSIKDECGITITSGFYVVKSKKIYITATPDDGYELESVKIGSTTYTAAEFTQGQEYTVTAATTISATFKASTCSEAPTIKINNTPSATANSITANVTGTATGANCTLSDVGLDVYTDQACTNKVKSVSAHATSGTALDLTASDLTHNTTYWIKAHATTGGGTTYTDAVKVTTDALYDTYELKGSFDNWGIGYSCQTIQGDANGCSIDVDLTAGTYEFKVKFGDSWYGNSGTMKRGGTSVETGGWNFTTDTDNCKLEADITGTYTFTIVPSGSNYNVTVKYPTCTATVDVETPSNLSATTASITATSKATITEGTCELQETGIIIYADEACTTAVKTKKNSTATSGTAYTLTADVLTHNTTYWVKAYAKTFAGETYSEAVSIKTQPINVTYAVAGTFNNWNTTANQCQAIKDDINGCSIDMNLKAGSHSFKIVIDGTTWKGNKGTMVRTGTSVQTGGWTFDGTEDNCTLTADITGTYTFTIVPSGSNYYKVTVKYPCNPCITSGNTLYLKPNDNWKKDKARFAANFSAEQDIWVDMTDDDGDGIYQCTIPEGCIGVVYLCRMNPNTTANNWNNKLHSTDGLLGSCGNYLFTVPEGDLDNSTDNGNWSMFLPKEPGAKIAATRNKTQICDGDLSLFASLYVYQTGEDDAENKGYKVDSYKWMYSTDGTSWSAYIPDVATQYGVKGKNNNIRTYQAGYYRCDVKLTNGSESKTLESNVIEVTKTTSANTFTDKGEAFPVFYINTSANFPTCSKEHDGDCGEDMKTKITVDVKMYDGGNLCYDRKARMNYRGSSSMNFPKKAFAFVGGKADAKADGQVKTDKLSFFGMPEHKDWVLYAGYPDGSMIRNILAYEAFSRMTGMWSVRTQLVQVYLDGQFQGVYVFMEKPSYGSGRIMVNENSGYIFKFDKTDEADRFDGDDNSIDAKKNTFMSQYSGRKHISTYGTHVDQMFEIEYPEREKIAFNDDEELVSEKAWTDKVNTLKARISQFESKLKDGDYNTVRTLIDYQTWADWFIMNEFSKNIDGFRASNIFIIENEGAPIKASPIWDFELTFGNEAPYSTMGESTEGWLHQNDGMHTDAFPIPFWFDGKGGTTDNNKTGTDGVKITNYGALLKDPCFKQMVKDRWAIHTAEDGGITGMIQRLNDAAWLIKIEQNLVEKEAARWPLGERNVAGYDAQASWSEQIAAMKDWLPKRKAAMDNLINGWVVGYMQTKIEDSTKNPWTVQKYTTQDGVHVYNFNEGRAGLVLVGFTKATDNIDGDEVEGGMQAATMWKFYPSSSELTSDELDAVLPENWQLLYNQGNYALPNLTEQQNGYYKVEGPLCGVNVPSDYLRIMVNMVCVNNDCNNYYYRILFTGASATENFATDPQKGNDAADLLFKVSLPAESNKITYTVQYKKGATEWTSYGEPVTITYSNPCIDIALSNATTTTEPTALVATHQICPANNYWISTPFAGHEGFDGGEQNVQHTSNGLDNNTMLAVDCQGVQGGAQGDFYLYKYMKKESTWNGNLAQAGVKDANNNNEEVATNSDSYVFDNNANKHDVWVRWLFNSSKKKLYIHHVHNIKLECIDSNGTITRVAPTSSDANTGMLEFKDVDLTNVSGYRIVANQSHETEAYTQQPWGADYHAPLTNLGTATFTYNYAQNCMTVEYSYLILLQIPCSDGGVSLNADNRVVVQVINAGTEDVEEGAYTVTVNNQTTPLTMRGTGTNYTGKALAVGEMETFTSTDVISDGYYITANLFYNTDLIGTCTLQSECLYNVGDTIRYTVDANLGVDYQDVCALTFGSLEDALEHLKATNEFTTNNNLRKPVVMEVAYCKTTYTGTRKAEVSAGGDEVANEVALIIDKINQTEATHPLIIRTSDYKALPWVHHVIIRNSRNITLDGLFIVSDVTGKVKDNALEIDVNSSMWDMITTGAVKDAKIVVKNSTIGSSGFTGLHASGYDGITFENNNFEAVFDGLDGNSCTWGASAKFIRCKNIKFLRNNFRGDHATLVWLQETTDALFMNNIFWNTNQYQGRCAAIRLVSQFGLPVNNMGFYYNTLFLANSDLNSYRYDFLRFGQQDPAVGSYPDSYTNIEFMYNNAYSYDTDIAGRNSNTEAFYGINIAEKFPNFCNNNFWSEYDQKAASEQSAFSFGCATQNMINVRDQLCTTTATGPASLIVRGDALNKGERPATQIAEYLGVAADYTADRYNEKIRPEKVTQDDINKNNGWTLGAYQMGKEKETTTIIWQGVASSDWDDRNNWIDKETGMRLNCLNLLSPDLIAIIPAEFSTQYPRPAEGISNWPKIPENFTTGRTNMDYNEHVSAGLGKVEESKIDLYVKDIVMEFGSGIEGVENLVENAGSNDETRRYNHVTYNFDVERSKWYLVGSVVKKQDANAEGGYRNVISGDYYIANHEPHVYMHQSLIDPETRKADWAASFPDLDVKVPADKVFAIQIPDQYGPNKLTAKRYYRKDSDKSKLLWGSKAWQYAFTGRFVNESAMPVYSGLTENYPVLLNNSYPMNIDARVIEEKGLGSVLLYNYEMGSFENIAGDGLIKPQHGFVIEPKGTSLAITPDMLVGGDTKTRSVDQEKTLYILKLNKANSTAGEASTVHLVYDAEQNGLQPALLDTRKVYSNNTSTPDLYMLMYDNAYQRLHIGNATQTIALGISLQESMSVSFEKASNYGFSQVTLVDTYTGKEYNMLNNDKIIIEALPAGVIEGRFFLNLAVSSDYEADDEVTTAVDEVQDQQGIQLYVQDGSTISITTTQGELQTVYVSDITGRTQTYNVHGTHVKIRPPVANGVYTVRVVGNETSRIEKVILNK